MFGKKPSKPHSRIDTLIGASTEVDGNLHFKGGLRVDGKVRGNVQASGSEQSTLVLSETGSVEGEVHVSHVVVNGTIVGPIDATEYVELQSKARVTGDVTYRSVEMHLGAIVEGKLIYRQGAADSAATEVYGINSEND